MTDYLNVGKIVNTQGIKGEVRVISKTDFPEERYQKGATLLLFQEKKAPIELVVKSHRKHKNLDNLAELAEDEFYYHQIIGATVYDETGSELGKIKEILSPGANDVWVVQRPKKKDLLLPYIEGVVTKVDVENQRIDVDIPEGLIDDEN